MLATDPGLTLLGATSLAGAGCGSGTAVSVPAGPPVGPTVPAHTEGRLTQKQAYTIGVAEAASSRCTEPERADLPPLRGFVTDLIRLTQRSPDVLGSAFGEPETTARKGLTEVAEQLETDGCQLDQAERARAALAALPPSP